MTQLNDVKQKKVIETRNKTRICKTLTEKSINLYKRYNIDMAP